VKRYLLFVNNLREKKTLVKVKDRKWRGTWWVGFGQLDASEVFREWGRASQAMSHILLFI